MRYTVFIGGQAHEVDLQRQSDLQEGGSPPAGGSAHWRDVAGGQEPGATDRVIEAHIGGRSLALDVSLIDARTLSLLSQGNTYLFSMSAIDSGKIRVARGGRSWDAEVKTGSGGTVHAARRSAKKGRIPVLSPMPGKVLRILSQEGSSVKSGDCIAIIEAMKMENEIKCPKDGLIVKVEAREGDIVDSGETILIVDDPA